MSFALLPKAENNIVNHQYENDENEQVRQIHHDNVRLALINLLPKGTLPQVSKCQNKTQSAIYV
jgi:hypothetical protein